MPVHSIRDGIRLGCAAPSGLIYSTASIVRPNVVRILDWGVTDDGVWYYAVDALGGDNSRRS